MNKIITVIASMGLVAVSFINETSAQAIPAANAAPIVSASSPTNVETILGITFETATQAEMDALNTLHKSKFFGGLKITGRNEPPRRAMAEVRVGDIMVEFIYVEALTGKNVPVLGKKDFLYALLNFKKLDKKKVKAQTPFGKGTPYSETGCHALEINLSKITNEQLWEDINKMKNE